jgi:RNA 3'-terminal phosphate cyclase (ATP)
LVGGSAVSSKGKEAADIGGAAAAELIKNLKHGGCVDEFLQVCRSSYDKGRVFVFIPS